MSEALLYPNETEFKNLIESGNVVLVDFYADWCGPCKMLAPAIEEIAGKYSDKISVAKVNIDEESSLAAEYGIMSIPTVIIFKNGKEMAKEIGVKPIEAYTEIIDGLLGDQSEPTI